MDCVTQLLVEVREGDTTASDRLLPVVYEELRRLAASRFVREQPGNTLQATALVHEAYLRLVGGNRHESWENRAHFFSAAAEAMRRILIEQARKRRGPRAGGDRQRVSMDETQPQGVGAEWLIEMDDALQRLAQEDAEAAELVKLRLYGGMSLDEAAAALQLPRTTAFRHWTYARAWLRSQLAGD